MIIVFSKKKIKDDTQFISAGAELDINHMLKIRSGYKYDIQKTHNPYATGGINISLGPVSLDSGVQYANGNEFGFAQQISYSF